MWHSPIFVRSGRKQGSPISNSITVAPKGCQLHHSGSEGRVAAVIRAFERDRYPGAKNIAPNPQQPTTSSRGRTDISNKAAVNATIGFQDDFSALSFKQKQMIFSQKHVARAASDPGARRPLLHEQFVNHGKVSGQSLAPGFAAPAIGITPGTRNVFDPHDRVTHNRAKSFAKSSNACSTIHAIRSRAKSPRVVIRVPPKYLTNFGLAFNELDSRGAVPLIGKSLFGRTAFLSPGCIADAVGESTANAHDCTVDDSMIENDSLFDCVASEGEIIASIAAFLFGLIKQKHDASKVSELDGALRRILQAVVDHQVGVSPSIDSEDVVAAFILEVLHFGEFQVSTCVLAALLLKKVTRAHRLQLTQRTWRPLFLIALMLADKFVQDHPLRSKVLMSKYQPFSRHVLDLELDFMALLHWRLLVKPEELYSFSMWLVHNTTVSESVQKIVASSAFGKERSDNQDVPDVTDTTQMDRTAPVLAFIKSAAAASFDSRQNVGFLVAKGRHPNMRGPRSRHIAKSTIDCDSRSGKTERSPDEVEENVVLEADCLFGLPGLANTPCSEGRAIVNELADSSFPSISRYDLQTPAKESKPAAYQCPSELQTRKP